MTYTGLRERLRRREPLTAAFLDLGSPVSAEVDRDVRLRRRRRRPRARRRRRGRGARPDPGGERPCRGDRARAGGARAGRPHARRGRRRRDRPAGRLARRGRDRGRRRLRYTGSRGISPLSRGNRYGGAGADFRPRADERLACIVQIERASALETVDAIAALDDVDGLLMGPADLSNDIGCALDLEGPELRAAAERIGAAAARHGKTAALHLGRAGPGGGVPRARLHDVLERVRERRALVAAMTTGRGGLEGIAQNSSSHLNDRPMSGASCASSSRPALRLLSRLRFAHKFALVGLVLDRGRGRRRTGLPQGPAHADRVQRQGARRHPRDRADRRAARAASRRHAPPPSAATTT